MNKDMTYEELEKEEEERVSMIRGQYSKRKMKALAKELKENKVYSDFCKEFNAKFDVNINADNIKDILKNTEYKVPFNSEF